MHGIMFYCISHKVLTSESSIYQLKQVKSWTHFETNTDWSLVLTHKTIAVSKTLFLL